MKVPFAPPPEALCVIVMEVPVNPPADVAPCKAPVELELVMHVVRVREVRFPGMVIVGETRLVTGAVPFIVTLPPAPVTASVVLVEVRLPVLRKDDMLLLLLFVAEVDASAVTVEKAVEVVFTVLVKLPSSVPVVWTVLCTVAVLLLLVDGIVVAVAVTVCGTVVVVV